MRWGGLGVRSTSDLAPSAFLSSIQASNSTVQKLLPSWALETPDPSAHEALTRWRALGGVTAPIGTDVGKQRVWDDVVCSARADALLQRAGIVDRARLLTTLTGSGSWINALPCANLGLLLGKDELRIAVGLRVGAPLVRVHDCVDCGAEVKQDGHHGLACRSSAGRHRRHALANDVIVRAIRSVEVHAELEPKRLLRDDQRRPDGATLDPWHRGKISRLGFHLP